MLRNCYILFPVLKTVDPSLRKTDAEQHRKLPLSEVLAFLKAILQDHSRAVSAVLVCPPDLPKGNPAAQRL